MTGCAFCEIAAGRGFARVVRETDDTLAFFPDTPAVRGHTLVIPKAHVADFLHAPPGVLAAVADATSAVGRLLDEVLRPEGMNTITSAREAATQTVLHWHVHVLPRWHGDRLGELWPEDQPTPSAELDELAHSLRQASGSSSAG